MIWARIILTAIAAVAGGAGIRLQARYWGPFMDDKRIALIALCGIFASTAVAVLIFSFFRVERRGETFVFKEGSAYLKLLRLFGSEEGKPLKLNICALFWATFVLVLATSGVLFMMGGFCYYMIAGNASDRYAIGMIAIVLSAGVFCLYALSKKENKLLVGLGKIIKYGLIGLSGVILVALIGLLVYLIITQPLPSPDYWKKVLFGLLALFGIGAGIVAASFLIGFMVIKVSRSGFGALIAKAWHYIITRTCPVISAIEVKSDTKEA